MRKFLLLVLIYFIHSQFSNAQNYAFESEISKRNGLVYFKGKPFTGKLFSDDDNIPNKCNCTLEAQYKNGKLNGYKKTYYKNGKPKFSGKYKMGVKNGTDIYYYENGKKKQVEKYVNGILTEKIRYYKNGNIQKKETYKNGKVIASILYNRNGTPKNKGQSTDIQTTNNINSSQIQKTVYEQKSQPEQSVVINKKQTIKPVKNNSKNINNTSTSGNIIKIQDGLQKTYFNNGQPKRISFYKNGLPVKDTLFYETGNLQLVKKYNDGELIHLESYYSDNVLEKEENYLNNKKHGIQKYNYKNGQPQKIEAYEYGLLIHSEEYNEKGKLIKEENYKFGKKHGPQKFFDKDGNLVELKVYDTGLLVKHERYTGEGKELINIQNDIAEIKVFNNQDKLISLKYEDIKTKQPDSLWLTFNPETGEKLTEKSYHKGKLFRKGQFLHNKKNGEWITYWQNGEKETHTIYDNGKATKTFTITYAKQIKNNYKKGDTIWAYTTYLPKKEDQFVLIRFVSVQTTSQKIIKKKILETLKQQGLKPIKNIEPIKDKELFAILNFSKFRIKLKSKNNEGKKFVTFIAFDFKYNNLKNGETFEKNFMITPATPQKPKYSSHYVKDKKEAFFKTLNNLTEKMKRFVSSKFFLSGVIRKKSGNSSNINEVFINLGTQEGIKKGDYFKVINEQGAVKARLKVTNVMFNASIAKVEEGKKWLTQYLLNNPLPVAIKTTNK